MELTGLAGQVAAVRGGQVKAVELVGSYLEEADRQQTLNAYVDLQAEEALASAARIDADVAAGRDPGPLAGAAIAVKDLFDHAGHVTTAGSSFYRHRAVRSATVIDRLEAAGAIIIGRTGLHEFAYGFSSENDWFGPVRNPWNPTWSPGGSSGGSAVAVAAGMAAAALGTDTGGSVRVPAALCGVVGLKVTHGRVPLTGVFPLAASLDTVGPLALSSEDAGRVYLALAGWDPADPWSVPIAAEPPAPQRLEGLNVGIPQPWTREAPSTPAVRDAFDRACAQLDGLGVRITEVAEPDLAPPGRAHEALSPEVAAVHRKWFGRQPYGPEVRERLAQTFEVTLDQYVEARAWQARLRNTTRRLFSEFDVLLTPTVPALRKVIGRSTVEGRPESYRLVLSWFSYLVNHAALPALALPLAEDGAPPPSLQLVGPWWSEPRLLGIGSALEEAGVVGYRAPPARSSPRHDSIH